MRIRPRVLPLAIALSALALTVLRAHGQDTSCDIRWSTCTTDLVEAEWIDALGERLQCGRMRAARDDDDPGMGTFDVGLVRVKAADSPARKGSLFFNFGGPGGNPLDFLPLYDYAWSLADASEPVAAHRRRIADRFDFVAVIPRGLKGGTTYACTPSPAFAAAHDPTVDTDDDAWRGLVEASDAFAKGCADDIQPYVRTLQHVRDMERARVALGEPAMNFLGISYGTWVGAYYAAVFPEHTGRMVLDSSMNFAGTFEDQLDDTPAERHALFVGRALGPAMREPGYGLGSDGDAIMRRLRAMPHRAREAWASRIDDAAQLAAALTLADWLREQGTPDTAPLIERIERHRFSDVPALDDDIRAAAMAFVDRPHPSPADMAVYYGVVCGDTPWRKTDDDLRVVARRIAGTTPEANGDGVVAGLVCRRWSSAPLARPPHDALARATPLLMVQAEFDPATPLAIARKAFAATPDAYMVVAEGMYGHGVFGMTDTPCIENAVGNYLLDGVLPAAHETRCDVATSRSSSHAKTSLRGPDEAAVRAELARRLRLL